MIAFLLGGCFILSRPNGEVIDRSEIVPARLAFLRYGDKWKSIPADEDPYLLVDETSELPKHVLIELRADGRLEVENRLMILGDASSKEVYGFEPSGRLVEFEASWFIISTCEITTVTRIDYSSRTPKRSTEHSADNVAFADDTSVLPASITEYCADDIEELLGYHATVAPEWANSGELPDSVRFLLGL
jgi:hypothetical protein